MSSLPHNGLRERVTFPSWRPELGPHSGIAIKWDFITQRHGQGEGGGQRKKPNSGNKREKTKVVAASENSDKATKTMSTRRGEGRRQRERSVGSGNNYRQPGVNSKFVA